MTAQASPGGSDLMQGWLVGSDSTYLGLGLWEGWGGRKGEEGRAGGGGHTHLLFESWKFV